MFFFLGGQSNFEQVQGGCGEEAAHTWGGRTCLCLWDHCQLDVFHPPYIHHDAIIQQEVCLNFIYEYSLIHAWEHTRVNPAQDIYFIFIHQKINIHLWLYIIPLHTRIPSFSAIFISQKNKKFWLFPPSYNLHNFYALNANG